jgi:CheY-like chemotaxis protein
MHEAETTSRGSLNVVVVDDQLDGAEMLADVLLGCGHSVRVATLGLDALRLLDEQCPDVLFLDLGLPELDGYEIARFVRHRFGDAIRVVAVTGFNTQQARELADWAGFDAFVAKPYKIQEIQASLEA